MTAICRMQRVDQSKGGKSQHADCQGKDVSKDRPDSMNRHPSMGLMTDTPASDAASPGTASSLSPHHRSPLPSLPSWDSLTVPHFPKLQANKALVRVVQRLRLLWLQGPWCPLISAGFELITALASLFTDTRKPPNCHEAKGHLMQAQRDPQPRLRRRDRSPLPNAAEGKYAGFSAKPNSRLQRISYLCSINHTVMHPCHWRRHGRL